LSGIGRQMQRLPLSPRLARVLLAAQGAFEACAMCARLSEPAASDHRNVEQSLAATAKSVLGDRYRAHIGESELRRALLAGYPDRVAKRRDRDTVTMASGHGAVIAKGAGVEDAEWMIALDVTAGRKTATTQALLRRASPIDREWLAATRSETIHELDATTGMAKAREVERYHALILREHPIAPDEDRRIDLLVEAWLAREPDNDSRRLLRRLEFAGMAADLAALAREGARSARKVGDIVLSEEALPWEARQRLSRHAPDRLTVPSGRDMTIEYPGDGRVEVSVKLQEVFGLAETPRIGPARTPITFHLLAPNQRPVQTTQDLKSFWERTYPEVRKELRGRYPRHPWPEDPWNAAPTHRTRRRS
jgi:ATP-dependent helicase HrpB